MSDFKGKSYPSKVNQKNIKMTLCDHQWPLRETSSYGKFAYSKCYHSYKVMIRSDLIQKRYLTKVDF